VMAAGDIAFAIDPGRARLSGLVARLRRFSEDLLAPTDIEFRFQVDGETDRVVLSSDQRRHLLAILKEALHNAVRHGRPRQLTLRLAVRPQQLEAEVEDDGAGFPQTGAFVTEHVRGDGREPRPGQGLRNMERRALEVNGYLEIESRPGAGTRVRLRIPV
jgi:signal transduction histidine kinase